MSQDRGPGFGPNTWLIEEMYTRYRQDPGSVSEAWQDFFDDYSSGEAKGNGEVPPPAQPSMKEKAASSSPELSSEAEAVLLRGSEGIIAARMMDSLSVPTATSVRAVPAKLLEINRGILNNHLARNLGGKVSFTHLIGWAVVRALQSHPAMNTVYADREGKPHAIRHKHVNLGLAVDVKRDDGSRTLLVPNIKKADTLDFSSFFSAYEELIRKVRDNKLVPNDFAETTVTITNPGTIGTDLSVPRLMEGQAAIIGVGAIGYPPEYEGSDPRTLAEIGIGKRVTLTSTYDHRVIQGATSGEFLSTVHDLLLGAQGFYEDVFESVGVPYVPVAWRRDIHPEQDSLEWEEKQARVFQLINMYRVRGHLIADLDPLDTKPPNMHPELDPATYGFTIWDLDRPFLTGGLAGRSRMPLSEILGVLRDAYCRTGTVEYMHISDWVEKRWIQERVEGIATELPKEDQQWILSRLNQAEAFETFLHRKYVGHKRFSLEGAESLIPMLDAVIRAASEAGIEETVMGMSHRGRLNVLTNIIGKSYTEIFREFEGSIDPESTQGSGDVKYHLGASGNYSTPDEKVVRITLASNPSHLESVDPVVEGMVRAKQDRGGDAEDAPILPLLIHGDAAFAGQGVVAETLNLSQLEGYSTGGTVHIVVNNQLGFTTGPDYARSSTYATDVAKMVQAPIFHVNGDDPEACVRIARLALEFRQAFRKDVVIDMWCYRRWGHNESDDPSFTQPLMYERIRSRRSPRKMYTQTLVNRGDLTIEEAEKALEEFSQRLQAAFQETKGPDKPGARGKFLESTGVIPSVETGVDVDSLSQLLKSLTSLPPALNIHPKLEKWLKERVDAFQRDQIDWALAEQLAFGTLLEDGITVRLAGQDSRRGTFSQRHAALTDQETGEAYLPLANIPNASGRFYIYDSLLSEFAALGFEYGYSVADPDALVLWEAQFGDFANGGQIIIDQFIAAGQDKWDQRSSMVLLLPHGYEGQGPEHSSARIERFLQLCAEDNMYVTVPSTPAQYFHLLRRQAHRRDIRRPLVVMTPKSFLRLPAARSPVEDLTSGHFLPVIDDPSRPEKSERVILCTGKVYYDLAAYREEHGQDQTSIIRVEQLYPFPKEALTQILSAHPEAEVLWVQEEPENMGAYVFMRHHFGTRMGLQLRGITRRESASPATGSYTAHAWEQDRLLKSAFTG